MSLLYPSIDEFDPCDIDGECIGCKCERYDDCDNREQCDCYNCWAPDNDRFSDNQYDWDDCDDDCKECLESGPVPGCLGWPLGRRTK